MLIKIIAALATRTRVYRVDRKMEESIDCSNSQEKVVGRLREKALLKDLIQSKKAEFIAVYGRRRVGKTFLIKRFVGSMPCVFFM